MNRREFPKSVKLAAWQRCGGFCEGCTAKLYPGKYDVHHSQEDTFGGEPILANAQVLCIACHSVITRRRQTVIAKSNRVRAKHLGLKLKRSSFATNKSGRWKKKISGEVVLR